MSLVWQAAAFAFLVILVLIIAIWFRDFALRGYPGGGDKET
jgi:hypothetical protein